MLTDSSDGSWELTIEGVVVDIIISSARVIINVGDNPSTDLLPIVFCHTTHFYHHVSLQEPAPPLQTCLLGLM